MVEVAGGLRAQGIAVGSVDGGDVAERIGDIGTFVAGVSVRGAGSHRALRGRLIDGSGRPEEDDDFPAQSLGALDLSGGEILVRHGDTLLEHCREVGSAPGEAAGDELIGIGVGLDLLPLKSFLGGQKIGLRGLLPGAILFRKAVGRERGGKQHEKSGQAANSCPHGTPP